MIYFISFFLVAIILQLGAKAKSKPARIAWFVLAALIPAVVAGCRDYSIGYDVELYGLPLFKSASSSHNIRNTLRVWGFLEPGYVVLSYICSRFSSNPHGFFFVIGLINYGLIIKAIYDYRDKVVPGIAWLCYAFLYFGDSLNIMRQSIAVAIVLVGFKYIRKRKIIRYAICIGIATLFHQTAIVAILFYFVYGLMRSRNKWIHSLWIICGTLVVMFAYNEFLQLLINIGIFTQKFESYMSDSYMGIRFLSVAIRLIPIMPVALFWKSCKRKNEDINFLIILLIMDMLMYNLSTVNISLYRIAMYMGMYRMFAYSTVCHCLNSKVNKKAMCVIYILYAMVVFTYQVVLLHGNQVYPYTSQVLGIG